MTGSSIDLIFFKYYDKENTFTLDTILDDNGKEKIDIMRIDYDVEICKEYFIDLWADNNSDKIDDLEFMFNVYKDLKNKINS